MDCRKHAGPLPGAHRVRDPALRPAGQVLAQRGRPRPRCVGARAGLGGWRAVAPRWRVQLSPCPASFPVAARFRGPGLRARWRDWVVCGRNWVWTLLLRTWTSIA